MLQLVGKNLKITNLDQCKDDYHGADELYILPLIADGKDAYRVAPLPRSPGFAGAASRAGRPRIYPVTPETTAEAGSNAEAKGGRAIAVSAVAVYRKLVNSNNNQLKAPSIISPIPMSEIKEAQEIDRGRAREVRIPRRPAYTPMIGGKRRPPSDPIENMAP